MAGWGVGEGFASPRRRTPRPGPKMPPGPLTTPSDDTILFPAGKEGTSLPHGSPSWQPTSLEFLVMRTVRLSDRNWGFQAKAEGRI